MNTSFDQQLSGLEATDLHIHYTEADLDSPRAYAYPGRRDVTVELNGHLQGLIEKTASREAGAEFSIREDNVLFRCRKVQSVEGSYLLLRRLSPLPPKLDDLNLPGWARSALLSAKLRSGGIIMVCGAPGQGKSTTCAATLVGRLERFGGMCITIEDPAEIILQGEQGKGYCLQIEVDDDNYHQAIKGSMKSYPTKTDSILYVGEVRDALAATHLVRSAIDGRLVLTTTHARDPISAIERMTALASETMGEQQARNLIATGLRLVMHQSLNIRESKVDIKALVNNEAVAGCIQSGRFKNLSTELDRQTLQVSQGVDLMTLESSMR